MVTSLLIVFETHLSSVPTEQAGTHCHRVPAHPLKRVPPSSRERVSPQPPELAPTRATWITGRGTSLVPRISPPLRLHHHHLCTYPLSGLPSKIAGKPEAFFGALRCGELCITQSVTTVEGRWTSESRNSRNVPKLIFNANGRRLAQLSRCSNNMDDRRVVQTQAHEQ